jgi:hypothetical protein
MAPDSYNFTYLSIRGVVVCQTGSGDVYQGRRRVSYQRLLDLNLSQINPYIINQTYLKSILILFSRLCVVIPLGFFPERDPTKILISSMRATCSSHLTLLDLIYLIIFLVQYVL